MNPNDIIKRPILTDKTTKLLENNQYCFAVNTHSNKIQIKSTLEKIFNVKIIKINTLHSPLRHKKVGRFQGYKPNYKKVIAKLSPESTINLFDEE
uniref:Ribosomal protein L23 n=1 Tax=Neogoniolithon spectabile TaxID=231755 RepID=A0A3G3MGS5_9FLOR|nr:ribosomal protein L23 [Neogoniolithon spectabile]AYR06035.1 ribosomal protein L23 [Neogoniolithon spectabile]